MRMVREPAATERAAFGGHYHRRFGWCAFHTARCGALWQIRLFLLFLASIVLSLFKAADLPGADIVVGGSSVTVVPTDIVLAALAVGLVARTSAPGTTRAAPSR